MKKITGKLWQQLASSVHQVSDTTCNQSQQPVCCRWKSSLKPMLKSYQKWQKTITFSVHFSWRKSYIINIFRLYFIFYTASAVTAAVCSQCLALSACTTEWLQSAFECSNEHVQSTRFMACRWPQSFAHICRGFQDMEAIQHRTCMTRQFKTWLPENWVSYNMVVDCYRFSLKFTQLVTLSLPMSLQLTKDNIHDAVSSLVMDQYTDIVLIPLFAKCNNDPSLVMMDDGTNTTSSELKASFIYQMKSVHVASTEEARLVWTCQKCRDSEPCCYI